MARQKWLAGIATALLTVAACSSTDDATTTSTPDESTGDDAAATVAEVFIERDEDLGGATEADIFHRQRSDGDPAPVVMMLHGTAADRTRLHELAEHVAGADIVVYVPDWPAIDQVQAYPADDDEPYRAQAEAVVCALRHIRLTADEHGGDPDDITVFGHSGGAMAGARVAVVDEPPWPGIDCDAGTPHIPRRFIGTAGDYEGKHQMSQLVPELYAPYDPTQVEPTNTDLEVRLIHGLADDSVGASQSSLFLGHAKAGGLDAALITTDSGHGDMIDPSTPTGGFVAQQVVALVKGEPSAFDLEGDSATMSFDGVCAYEGPATFEVGRPLDVEVATARDPQIWLLVFSIKADSTVTDEEILAIRDTPIWPPPEFVDTGGLELIDEPRSETIRLVFLEGGQRWVLACVPDEPPEAETPMIPHLAVVLSPA